MTDEEKEKTPPAPEGKPADEFSKALADMKAAYEKKYTDLEAQYKKTIEEQTEVIKQLVTGKVEGKPEEAATVADRINQKRKYVY